MANNNKSDSNIGFILFIIHIIFISCIVCGIKYIFTYETRTAEKFHAQMEGITQYSQSPISGEKVVSVHDQTFTTDHIPDSLLAKSPEEVHFIVYCKHSDVKVGSYSNGGGAYTPRYEMSIWDRNAGCTVAVNIFWGGSPPISTSAPAGFGSRPSESIIEDWITESINEYLN